MPEALINGDVLRWARQRAGTSLDVAAQKIKVSPDTLDAWERGESRPTFAKARDLARVLRVPFGYLFLANHPADPIDTPDLRRIGSEMPVDLGPDFLAVYQDAKLKQDWYRDYLLRHGAQPLGFVGRWTLDSPPDAIAAHLRETLGLTADTRRQARNWEDYFRILVKKAEAAGVIVLRNSIVGNNTHRSLSVDEFRGFALSDGIAPLVFINSGDVTAAQTFSLIHELAHIWINRSAISNYTLRQLNAAFDPVEILCNRVAAETLVSRAEFQAAWPANTDLAAAADQLSREFKVSGMVIARRALDLGRVTREQYLAYYDEVMERFRRARDKPKDGSTADFWKILQARNSPTFSRAVLSEALEGRILLRDAGRLLSLKPAKLNDYARELEG